jgi:predicted dehydrogenase
LTIRLGLVGAGAIAQLAHLPVLSRIKGAQLVAICDNDGPKAGALAQRLGVPDIFTDMDELLDSEEVDAVVIATPNHLHELTIGGVNRILQAAKSADVKVVVGNNHRFRSDVQQLSRFLEGGELGRTIGIRAGQYQFRSGVQGWRHRKAEAGGGAFLEYGYPLLDLALWLANFPEPVRVSAQMDSTTGGSVEDMMVVHLECAKGISFIIDVSWAYVGQEERWWFEVVSSRGSARLSPLRVVKELNGRPTNVSPTGAAARESVFLQSYRAEIAHFIAVLSGDAAYEAPTDQLQVMRIMEAVYKSAEEGREIRF